MNRIIASISLFCATFVVPPMAALGGPITVPDLPAGTQYRLVFVTSTTLAVTSSDIGTYNNFVNSLANTPGGPLDGLSTWTAIASTAAVAAEDNTSTNPGVSTGVPIYNLGGDLVASSNAALLGYVR